MDPDENLRIQLETAKQIQAIWDDCNGDGTLTRDQSETVAQLSSKLADYVLVLDEWLKTRGSLPQRWQKM